MNKKGFTLIEVLAVIVIVGIVAAISTVSLISMNKKAKEKMLEDKYALIEKGAVLYAEGVKETVVKSSKKYNGYNCIAIKVKDLVPNYLDKDTDTTCGSGCILDPSDTNNYLDNKNVIIYYRNSRLYAKANVNGCA